MLHNSVLIYAVRWTFAHQGVKTMHKFTYGRQAQSALMTFEFWSCMSSCAGIQWMSLSDIVQVKLKFYKQTLQNCQCEKSYYSSIKSCIPKRSFQKLKLRWSSVVIRMMCNSTTYLSIRPDNLPWRWKIRRPKYSILR